MNIFFDNCTPPVLASTLDGFVREFGHRATHIKDLSGLKDGRHASDLAWIERLKSDEKVWIFITADMRVLKNPAERAALRSAGLHGFVLAPAYQKAPFHEQASTLVWKWEKIAELVALTRPPAMFEIPIQRGTKLRPLPL